MGLDFQFVVVMKDKNRCCDMEIRRGARWK